MEKSPGDVPGALLESESPVLDSLGEDIGNHPNLAALHPDIGPCRSVGKADGIADGSCPISPNADAGVNGRG